jgi:HEAT repeat protein
MELRNLIGQSNFFFTRACTCLPAGRRARSILFVFALVLASISSSIIADSNFPLDAQTQQQLQAIQNANTQICLPAIEALGRSNNPAVVKPLADAFAQENRPVVRRYIVEALGYLRNRATIPTLKQALNDPDIQVRQSAVAAVGLLRASDVQSLLLEHAASEKDPVIKRQIVHHLGLLHTPEAKNALKTFSQDKDATVRDMAGKTLERHGEKEAK